MKPRDSSWRRSERDDAGARREDRQHLGIGDQVEITLAVAQLDVLQAVVLLGQAEEVLGKEDELIDVHRQLAGARAEEIACDADDVAEVEQLVELEFGLRNGILLDIDLELGAALLEMHEAGLAHAADGQDAAGETHRDAGGVEFFGGLRAAFGPNLGDRVGEVEALPVGPEPQRLDLANAREALFKLLLLEGQKGTPWKTSL